MQHNSSPQIAIIGLGNIGQVVAKNLIKHNRSVIVADRTIEKASHIASELGALAIPATISDAITQAEVIVVAVWFSTIKEIFYQYEALFQGKIVIDPSNPIAPNEKGGFEKIIPADASAGQFNASILPQGAKLAKALGTLGAASLASAADQPEPQVLFYASDDTDINPIVEQVIIDNGFVPVRVGTLEQSIRIEVFGDLHEFGALGKTVTLAEALTKI